MPSARQALVSLAAAALAWARLRKWSQQSQLVLGLGLAVGFVECWLQPKRHGGPGLSKDKRFASLSHGQTRYTIWGWSKAPELRKQQKLVVLVHGFSSPSGVFHDVARDLALAGYVVLSYDLYGRGWSDSPCVPYTTALFVSQLAELLTWLQPSFPPAGRSVYALLGYSMGGVIASNFVTKFPQRVQRLIMCSPAGAMPRPSAVLLSHLPPLGTLMGQRYLVPMVRRKGQATVTMLRKQGRAEAAAALEGDFAAQLTDSPCYARALVSTLQHTSQLFDNSAALHLLADLPLPTLLLWAEDDEVCPFAGATNVQQILSSRGEESAVSLVPVTGAKHGFVVTHAGLVAQEVLTFLVASDGHFDKGPVRLENQFVRRGS